MTGGGECESAQQGTERSWGWGDDEQQEIERELGRCRQEHSDLDAAIDALETLTIYDRIQVQRLKKRKLVLKDRIRHLEDMLTPDIIA